MSKQIREVGNLIKREMQNTKAEIKGIMGCAIVQLGIAPNHVDDLALEALKPILSCFSSIEALVSELKAQLVLFNKIQALDDGE